VGVVVTAPGSYRLSRSMRLVYSFDLTNGARTDTASHPFATGGAPHHDQKRLRQKHIGHVQGVVNDDLIETPRSRELARRHPAGTPSSLRTFSFRSLLGQCGLAIEQSINGPRPGAT